MPVRMDLHDLDAFLGGKDSDDEEEIEVVGDVPVEQGRVEDVAVTGEDVDGITGVQDYTLLYKNSIMNVGLGNLDLGLMVNGYPGDPIDLRPYDNTFTRLNILKW